METWIVKEGKEKRIQRRHPWVFAGELRPESLNSPPGELIKLTDSQGEFLAFGYGNTDSTISFRALSFSAEDENVGDQNWLYEKIKKAWAARLNQGMKYSYRLCYSEADGLPGLIIDYYTLSTASGTRNVASCQILTAGMNGLFENLKEALARLFDFENTAIVIRNDSNIRRYENLPVEKPYALNLPNGIDLKNAEVLLLNPITEKPIILKTDFLGGQKTGLFLDQSWNIRVLCEILARRAATQASMSFRILDLCCYVGQWSTQLAHFLIPLGHKVEVTLLDASEKSLHFAAENVRATGASVNVIRGDVLRDLMKLSRQEFDVVISDPPAFIKNKKEISQGKHGYLKLNTEAFRLVAKDGFVATCSCSGLLNETDLDEILKKAAKRSGREMLVVARGGHAPDHPVLDTFPEGRYLKMVLHRFL